MISKVILVGSGIVVGAAAAVGVTQPQLFSGSVANAAGTADTYRELSLFGEVFERVRADYVEVPDEQKMIESAINGMLTSLDPHSSFQNAKETDDMQVTTSGKFGGLGIELTMQDGVVKVMSPMDGTPAAKAGILANDLIVGVDGNSLQGVNLDDAVSKMRGKIGTPITLTIQRPNVPKPFDVKLVRAEITIEAVRGRAEGDIALPAHRLVHRAGLQRPRKADQEAQGRNRARQDQGLHPRPAQQSRRPAQPGGRHLGRVPERGRDRHHPRAARRPG